MIIKLLLVFKLMTFLKAEETSYLWKKRVIKCEEKLYKRQFAALKNHQKKVDDLKLVLISDQKNTGCRLIGLDGGVKVSSQKIFEIIELEKIINAMPMRVLELERKK